MYPKSVDLVHVRFPDLTSDKILAFFPLLKGIIKKNSVLARIRLASNENHDKKG